MNKSKIVASLVIAATVFSMSPAAVSAAEISTEGSNTTVSQEQTSTKAVFKAHMINDYMYCDQNGKVYRVTRDKNYMITSKIPVRNEGFVSGKGDDLYCVDSNGYLRTGFFEMYGNNYYADENGLMQKNKKFTANDGKMYYCRDDRKVVKNDFIKAQDNNFYNIDADGVITVGWFERNGEKYYADKDGVVQCNKVVKDQDGKLHFMNQAGRMQVDCDAFDNKGNEYFIDKDGVVETGFVYEKHDYLCNGEKFYADENGVIQKDQIITYEGKNYLCSENGSVPSQAGVWELSNGESYKVDENGVVLYHLLK